MNLDELIERYLASEGRDRKKLLKQVLAGDPGPRQATRLAPTLRDPSPRVAARITALLARHQLREVFEQQLVGLKPGKLAILRGHFDKIAKPGR
ncbi:MAG: hypothetical protein VX764_00805 [Planctomycetota bacterium]|nr:hypothetical protein [Planctomycetota bacterium]